MNIGITLLFTQEKHKAFLGIKKSLVINAEKETFKENIRSIASEIAQYYNYTYYGINDIYAVSGSLKEGEVLGRTSYYELNTIKDSLSLKINDLNILTACNYQSPLTISLIYFCKDEYNVNFTITVFTIIKQRNSNCENELLNRANSQSFKNKIQKISAAKIINCEFIGVEDIIETDLKFNTFLTEEAMFESKNQLIDEILDAKDIQTSIDYVSSY